MKSRFVASKAWNSTNENSVTSRACVRSHGSIDIDDLEAWQCFPSVVFLSVSGKHFLIDPELKMLYEGSTVADHQVPTWYESLEIMCALVQQTPLKNINDLENVSVGLLRRMQIDLSTTNRVRQQSRLHAKKGLVDAIEFISIPQVIESTDKEFVHLTINLFRLNDPQVFHTQRQDENNRHQITKGVTKAKRTTRKPKIKTGVQSTARVGHAKTDRAESEDK
jgi:hypothetical protein